LVIKKKTAIDGLNNNYNKLVTVIAIFFL